MNKSESWERDEVTFSQISSITAHESPDFIFTSIREEAVFEKVFRTVAPLGGPDSELQRQTDVSRNAQSFRLAFASCVF